MTMRKKLGTITLAVLLGCGMQTFALCESASAEQILNSTAAVVNNDIILESELNSFEKRILSQHRGLDQVSARKMALEQLITRSLLLQQARDQGADMTDSQIDSALAQAAARNNTTPDKILSSMGSNLSVQEQRDEFKNQVLMNEFRQSRVRSRIKITDAEVDNLANNLKTNGTVEPRYHIGQVLIPLSSNPTGGEYERAQANARQAKTALQKGADLTSIVAQYSSGAASSQSGDLGYLPESQVPLPFVPALVKSKPGDVVGPFRSPLGMHVLKVYDITHDAITPIKTYDAAHILVKTSIIFSDDAARAKLENLRASILSGEISFGKAARQNSEDPGSAVSDGDLGYATPDRYDPAFARAMVALKPGQISEPFKSSFGWHIIYLKDIRVDQNSDDAYKDRARSIIAQRKYQEELGMWEKELRDSAYIHIIDPILLENGVNLEQNAR